MTNKHEAAQKFAELVDTAEAAIKQLGPKAKRARALQAVERVRSLYRAGDRYDLACAAYSLGTIVMHVANDHHFEASLKQARRLHASGKGGGAARSTARDTDAKPYQARYMELRAQGVARRTAVGRVYADKKLNPPAISKERSTIVTYIKLIDPHYR